MKGKDALILGRISSDLCLPFNSLLYTCVKQVQAAEFLSGMLKGVSCL